jgi:hypothetical protein
LPEQLARERAIVCFSSSLKELVARNHCSPPWSFSACHLLRRQRNRLCDQVPRLQCAPDDGLEEWENELDKTLKNQDSTYVEFDDSEEGCVWNIKVIWADYDEAVLWKNVNLCKFTALRLRYDPGTKTTSFIAE